VTGAEPTDALAEARVELEQARRDLRHVRARVAVGDDGASAAEWRLHQALQRVDELAAQPDDSGAEGGAS
jgi:hypothetical protein